MKEKIRYAVLGLGYIAQKAVLPSFKNARRNSELAALVSGDPKKLKVLGRKYGVTAIYPYSELESCLSENKIDAVYIATPNDTHLRFAELAAKCGVHVLCEKPMEVNEEKCARMTGVAVENKVKLMIAYRLHLQEANLKALKLATLGRIGQPKIFSSNFTMQVRDEGNIRLKPRETGGGPLFDIGIYCINAARMLFRDEPTEVFGTFSYSSEPRFKDSEESVTAILKFPEERVGQFTASFGASDVSSYQLIGTKGSLHLENAYDYALPMELTLTVGAKKKKLKFKTRDQFGPELLYFSDCILEGKDPEPSGVEGLADLRVIDALFKSASQGAPVKIQKVNKVKRASFDQEINRGKIREPELIRANSPEEKIVTTH